MPSPQLHNLCQALGLPQPRQPLLQPWACQTMLQARGTNPHTVMGNPAESKGFPTSPLPPLHIPGPSQESCDSSSSNTHFTPTSLSSLYPNNLSFGDSLPASKLDSNFWVSFCYIGGFLAIAGNNDKVWDIKNFIASNDLDIFGRCESNLNWQVLPNQIQLWTGSILPMDALLSMPTILTKTLVNFNMVAHFGLLLAMLLHTFLPQSGRVVHWDAGCPAHY